MNLTIKDKILLLFTFGILFSTYPFVFVLIIPLPSVNFLMLITIFVFLLYGSYGYKHIPRLLLFISFVQSLAVLVNYFFVHDWEYLKEPLYLLWVIAFLSLILTIGCKKFLFYYNRLILIVAILGVFSFFLTLFLGENILMEFEEMDGRQGRMTYATFTNAYVGNFIRYAGIFDEPGAMAGWGMFSLVTNRLYVKDSKLEIPLMLALLFTFSLAYIIQIAVYFYFFYIIKAKRLYKLMSIVITSIVLITLFLTLDHSSEIYLLTFGRLGIGTTFNLFTDSSRIEPMLVAKQYFHESPWFGIGLTRFANGAYAGDNPYETLATHGVVGSFFLYLPLLCCFCFTRFNRSLLVCSFILLLGYLQRPFHVNCIHFIMLYIFFYIAFLNYRENGRIKFIINNDKSSSNTRSSFD